MNAQPSSGLIHFNKWKRKGYSLFQVVGKLVKIGVLTIAYLAVAEPAEAQKELRKLQNIDDTDVTLEEVEVKGQRISTSLSEIARLVTVVTQKEIARSPYSSIQEYLDQELSIDIRQRGPIGVQTDISMKGSTYEQVLILINGIPFNDPQTGHFNGDIPVPLKAVQRIEIIEGGASRWLGPNAFAGAINIITTTVSPKKLDIGLQTGQHGFLAGEAIVNTESTLGQHSFAGSYIKTSGYSENTDLKSWNSFYSGRYRKNNLLLKAQAGAGYKKFGAQAFYTPLYPNQYEEVGSSFGSVGWEKKGRLNLSQDVYLKYHLDEFHLFRNDGPSWYSGPNQHLTRTMGLINSLWWNNFLGKAALGLDYRSESIWSTVLGLPDAEGRAIPGDPNHQFTHSANRQSFSLYGEQSYQINKLSIVAGLLVQTGIKDSMNLTFFPGLDVKYRTSSNSHIFASINRSLRTPTFTELYYSSPTNQGNPLLKDESAWSAQTGYKMSAKTLSIKTNIYGNKSQNNIDWSKAPGEEIWTSRNINEMYQMGIEIQGQLQPIQHAQWKDLHLKVGYRYGYVSKTSGDYDSRYVLDYLQHKVVLSAYLPIYKRLDLTIVSNFQDRAGSYTDWDAANMAYQHEFEPFWLIDLKLRYKLGNAKIFVDVSNLFNQEYADIGQVWQPGRWVRFGGDFSITR